MNGMTSVSLALSDPSNWPPKPPHSSGVLRVFQSASDRQHGPPAPTWKPV